MGFTLSLSHLGSSKIVKVDFWLPYFKPRVYEMVRTFVLRFDCICDFTCLNPLSSEPCQVLQLNVGMIRRAK
jgi:hypothetical protein